MTTFIVITKHDKLLHRRYREIIMTGHLGSHLAEAPFMRSSSESQSRYLSLAIACRQLIHELQRYRETGIIDKALRASLQDLLELLQESTSRKSLFGPIPTDSPFSRYEQLLTLREVFNDFRESHLREKF